MNGLVLPDVALAPMMPILLTLLGAIAATVLGFFLPRRAVAVISLVSLVLSAVSMFTLWDRGLTSFGGSLQADNAAIALGIVLLIGSALAVLVSLDTAGRSRLNFPEFDAVLMFAVTGTLVIAFSGDLITMLIGLEVMSLSGYVLATLQDSRESEESGLKYFLLGATGSAILIYGIALVYGATGSFNFAGIAAASSGLQIQNSPLLVAGALLLLCGFGFKVALAPFHQWTPDVYGGAPTVVSLFLSTTVKVGAFAGLLRVFSGALHNAPNWLDVLAILTAATLVVGNLAALFQTNFKRLLAYSAVAQTGFLALTLLGTPELGGAALAYYLLVYPDHGGGSGGGGEPATLRGGPGDLRHAGAVLPPPWVRFGPRHLPRQSGWPAAVRRVHGEVHGVPGGLPERLHLGGDSGRPDQHRGVYLLHAGRRPDVSARPHARPRVRRGASGHHLQRGAGRGEHYGAGYSAQSGLRLGGLSRHLDAARGDVEKRPLQMKAPPGWWGLLLVAVWPLSRRFALVLIAVAHARGALDQFCGGVNVWAGHRVSSAGPHAAVRTADLC